MQLLLFISCPVLTESINNTVIDYVNEFLNVGRYISKQENISIILWKFYNKLYMNQYYFVSCLNILNFINSKDPHPLKNHVSDSTSPQFATSTSLAIMNLFLHRHPKSNLLCGGGATCSQFSELAALTISTNIRGLFFVNSNSITRLADMSLILQKCKSRQKLQLKNYSWCWYGLKKNDDNRRPI